VWPALAEILGVQPGQTTPMSVARTSRKIRVSEPDRSEIRSSIADLRRWLVMGTSMPTSPLPMVLLRALDRSLSTIKLRQAGFTKTIDTEQAFRNALHSLSERKLLPPTSIQTQ